MSDEKKELAKKRVEESTAIDDKGQLVDDTRDIRLEAFMEGDEELERLYVKEFQRAKEINKPYTSEKGKCGWEN